MEYRLSKYPGSYRCCNESNVSNIAFIANAWVIEHAGLDVKKSRLLNMLVRIPLSAMALFLVVEEWLWDHLRVAVVWSVQVLRLDRLARGLTGWVTSLSPSVSLALFCIPFLCLLPLKVLGIWFFAHSLWMLGILTVLAAKLIGMAVTAFIFDLTKPKLLTINWFRLTYERVTFWLAWAHERVEPIRVRIRSSLNHWRETLGRIRRKISNNDDEP